MSLKINDTYLESAQENFQSAVLEENWDFARAVIADMKDMGFEAQAAVLEKELKDKQNEYGDE